MFARLLLRLLPALILAPAAWGDIVQRRGTEPAVEGRVSIMDDAGVTVRTELGAVRFIPWDRVRNVETELTDPRLDRFLNLAEDLWRARSRLERRDSQLAEPLLERLFEQYRGRTHETALVVAEGLLRCRLDRGDHTLAVIPALESARIRRAGVRTDSYSMLGELIDEETALCTMLAPVWTPGPAVPRLQRDLADYDAQGDEVIAAMARLYRRAARQQAGMSPGVSADEQLPNHRGVELLQVLVDCMSDDSAPRSAARQRLIGGFNNAEPWLEAWRRFHLGLSQIGERGLGRRQRGMVNLLHLPGRFAASQPYLAGLALAVVSEALESEGRADPAASLRAELNERYPGHSIHAAIADGLPLPWIFPADEDNS